MYGSVMEARFEGVVMWRRVEKSWLTCQTVTQSQAAEISMSCFCCSCVSKTVEIDEDELT
jgi:hypothetical protein